MKLTADVQYGNDCRATLTKDIRIFPFSLAYIGDKDSMKIPAESTTGFVSGTLAERNILYHEFTPPATQSSLSFQEFDEFVTKNISVIEESDVLVINTVNFLSLFDSLAKITNTLNGEISLAEKQIFVVSDINESFLAKILGQSIGRIGISDVSLVNPTELFELILKVTPENLSF